MINDINKVLKATAKRLVANHKGLLAMDESISTCNRRFEKIGIPQTAEYRRLYRELIVTTPGLGDYLNGAILYDETIYQSTSDGIPFVKKLKEAGVVPGIKVDEGTIDLIGSPGERITTGLKDLPGRLKNYGEAGMRFAKWRAVFSIGNGVPTKAAIEVNTRELAIYAKYCQEAAIVPIVEPEVLITGTHSIERCHAVTGSVLAELFVQLREHDVNYEHIILKPNMVTSGDSAEMQATPMSVAQHTIECLANHVPAGVPGIAFLSGGQVPATAIANLNAMNLKNGFATPWPVTFSFSRAIQQPALEFWAGKPDSVIRAQNLLYTQLERCGQARKGVYRIDSDN